MSPWPGWEHYTPPLTASNTTNYGAPAPKPKRRSKYNAVPHVVLPSLLIVPCEENLRPAGSVRFDSKREAERFVCLRQELEAGTITDLLLQEQFPLSVTTREGVRVILGRFISDFSYTREGRKIVEDVKGFRGNALYQWKRRHVENEYGIQIVEV